ncbi:MAG: hypothetical protein M1820_008575 [Bogoriella megaspora]|nr:MAG: hypothetical protein M1820_008575 [Bogoriella megaspora]
MDSVILDDSPLAQYLEGEGTHDPTQTSLYESEVDSPDASHNAFAPRGIPGLRRRLKDRIPAKLQLQIPSRSAVGKVHDAWSRAINSRMGRAENTRFLEHFRYIIVASQLLNENHGPTALRPNLPQLDASANGNPASQQGSAPTSLLGAAITAFSAFALVWLINWARPARGPASNKTRVLTVLVVFSIVAAVVYVYARRQWLRFLREQAVESVSALVAHIQGLDACSSSALSLIQEVELVARGYRLCVPSYPVQSNIPRLRHSRSSPLPPISRLDGKTQTTQSRRCQRLRKALRDTFALIVPQFSDFYKSLRGLADENDFEKYLDVYEIENQDLQEAALGYDDSENDEQENLRLLKLHHYRHTILQKIILCSLLALEADGGKPDFARWRTAVDVMDKIVMTAAQATKNLADILEEEGQFNIPQTPAKALPSTPGRERVRNQVRKLSSLSQGIRGLQAKMQILREESNKTLEASDDVTELGSTLMQQYESIGSDLKALQQAWEDGKKSLAINIDKHERRVSLASSSGLRSPVPSLGGLTAVEEGSGSPGDALRALNGEVPGLSSATSATSESDEEVFEAIALPRQRTLLSREERIAKMQEERERRATLMEKRSAETNMLRELESVISLRQPKKAATTGRITSI